MEKFYNNFRATKKDILAAKRLVKAATNYNLKQIEINSILADGIVYSIYLMDAERDKRVRRKPISIGKLNLD